MPDLIQDNPAASFSKGFSYPFRGLRLLSRYPALLKYIVIPFLINLIIFSSAVYFGLDFFKSTVVQYIPQGEAWYWAILYYAAWILAVLVTAVLVFFLFTVVGNLIASPFNDLLSERAEEYLLGKRPETAFSFKGFFRDARSTLLSELKKMSFFLIGMVFLLLLNLIPALGQLVYSVAAILFTLFFLVMEYLGYVFGRKNFTFRDQRLYIWRRKFLTLGFGTGVLCMLAVPFLQFLCLPLAVLGATLLWCENSQSSCPGKPQS
jgi:CysZ protein